LVYIIAMTVLTAIYFPESPKYLYSRGRYDELRECFRVIAVMNGVSNFKKETIEFDTEAKERERLESQSTPGEMNELE